MTVDQLATLFGDPDNLEETQTLEFKKARSDIPADMWESYSAFANAEGGTIVLGVEESISDQGHTSYSISGVAEPSRLIKEFWDTARNPQRVSDDIVFPDGIYPFAIGAKTLVALDIPRADRSHKPIKIYDKKTKRMAAWIRRGSADYRCTDKELARMVSDSLPDADATVLEDMNLAAFNKTTLRSYRSLLGQVKPSHPWLRDDDEDFLFHLGAVRRGRDAAYHPTRAGLLAFGNEYEIIRVFANYHLDYREQTDQAVRWSDRLDSMSGDWSGNVLDFYFGVTQRIDRALPQSFGLEDNGMRHSSRTEINDAIHEAIANALIHAYYGADSSISVVLEPTKLTVSNSGTFLINRDVAIAGGITETRNPLLMRMFSLIGIVDRAGSGLQKIFTTWEEKVEQAPILIETYAPDGVKMELPLLDALHRKRSYKPVPHDEILRLCKEPGGVTAKDLVNLLGMKLTTAQLVLRTLASNGELTREKIGKAYRYTVPDQ